MSIHDKLLVIQTSLKAPKSQTNTFGKYKYRSCEDILEAVKPLLKEHGLVLTISDEIVGIGGRVYVKATTTLWDGSMTHGSLPSDALVHVSAFARESLDKKGMDEAQITGAASSYARKYALNGLFCIDDTKDADSMDNTKTATKPSAAAAPKTVASPNKKASPADLRRIAELAKELEQPIDKVYEAFKVQGAQPTEAQAKNMIDVLNQKVLEKNSPFTPEQ